MKADDKDQSCDERRCLPRAEISLSHLVTITATCHSNAKSSQLLTVIIFLYLFSSHHQQYRLLQVLAACRLFIHIVNIFIFHLTLVEALYVRSHRSDLFGREDEDEVNHLTGEVVTCKQWYILSFLSLVQTAEVKPSHQEIDEQISAVND